MFLQKTGPTPALLDVSFSESVQAAMSFVFAAAHEQLPEDMRQQVNIREAHFFGLPLVQINEVSRTREYDTYFERCLEFFFGQKEREWVHVRLRKNKDSDSKWRPVSMTYAMSYNGLDLPQGCRDLKARYELVVERYNIGDSKVTRSGFRDLNY